MIAFKGFTGDLRSIYGNGDKKTCSFAPGITLEVPNSKTGREGFHCCENPFNCLKYYSMNGKNRFWKVEVQENIDEDEYERIACTKITLLEELTPLMFAMEGIKYIINHPQRDRWQQAYGSVQVKADRAEAVRAGHIAIARGVAPAVKGVTGSILGILVDGEDEITECKLLVVNEEQSGKWLTIEGKKVVFA